MSSQFMTFRVCLPRSTHILFFIYRSPTFFLQRSLFLFLKNKGERRIPRNYRPITLLSISSEVQVIMSLVMHRILPLILSDRRPEHTSSSPFETHKNYCKNALTSNTFQFLTVTTTNRQIILRNL